MKPGSFAAARHWLRSVGAGRGGRLHEAVASQVEVARAASVLCQELVTGIDQPAAARARMTKLEHLGDEYRGALVRGMSRTLVTPIDREDLFRLSRAIDDVVDDLRDFVREYDLFGVVPNCDMSPMVTAITDALDELALASRVLRDEPSEAFAATLRTKKRAGAVRQAYQTVLAGLLDGCTDTAATFKNVELLRRLDAAGLSLHEAADALADGALKRVS